MACPRLLAGLALAFASPLLSGCVLGLLGGVGAAGAGVAGVAGAAGAVGSATAGVSAVAATGAAVGTAAGTAATVAGVSGAAGAGLALAGSSAGAVGSGGVGLAAVDGALNLELVNGVLQQLPVAAAGVSLPALPSGLAPLGTLPGAALPAAVPLLESGGYLYRADRLLVQALSPAGRAQAQALGLQRVSARTLPRLALPLVELQLPPGVPASSVLPLLQAADPRAQVELNPVYRLASVDCRGIRCYAPQLLRWPPACRVQARIGLIDGPVVSTLPALRGATITQRRWAPDAPPPAAADHGTGLAAWLVGQPAAGFPGLLPDAALWAADVYASDAQGEPYTDAARLVEALDWLAGEQVEVINLSLAGAPSALLHTALRRVVQSGIGVVAAVGNGGPASPPLYPAAYPEVIAVTAVDRHRQRWPGATPSPAARLAAPGVAVWALDAGGGGRFQDGTSWAAPFLTAAYVLQARLTPERAPLGQAEALVQRARPLPGPEATGLLQAPACPAAR